MCAIGICAGMPSDNGSTITWFDGVRPTYFPIVWFDVETQIDDEDANKFKTSVYGGVFISELCLYGNECSCRLGWRSRRGGKYLLFCKKGGEREGGEKKKKKEQKERTKERA